MRIAIYYNYLSGIGHNLFVYSIAMQIKRKMPDSELLIICGGKRIRGFKFPQGAKILYLLSLEAESGLFNGLRGPTGMALDSVKGIRARKLFKIVSEFKPDIFITEHFPFGRHNFNFEILPTLRLIKKKMRHTLVLSSLSVLGARTEREKRQKFVFNIINKYYDYILIHTDEGITKLDEDYSFVGAIKDKVIYTGYLNYRFSDLNKTNRIKKNLSSIGNKKLIVVNVGGGRDGHQIINKVIKSEKYLNQGKKKYFFMIFSGPNLSKDSYFEIQKLTKDNPLILLKRFCFDISPIIGLADLSISMGGYNAAMDMLITKKPTIFFPRLTDPEQTNRLKKLSKFVGNMESLRYDQISPLQLSEHIENLSNKKNVTITKQININGAEETATFLKKQKIFLSKKKEALYYYNIYSSMKPNSPLFEKPRTLRLELTLKCNYNCEMCYQKNIPPDYKEPPIGIAEIKTIITKSVNNLGINHMNLIGGEILLLEDICEILSYLDSLNVKFGFVTNASITNPNVIKKINQLKNLQNIYVSLDGPEHINDEMREKGSFNKALEFIKNTKKNIYLNSTITLKNINHLNFILDFVKEHNLKGIEFNLEMFSTIQTLENSAREKAFTNIRDKKYKDKFDSLIGEKLNELEDYAIRTNTPINIKPYLFREKIPNLSKKYESEVWMCREILSPNLRVDTRGNVILCSVFRKSFGNLLTKEVNSIWSSNEFNNHKYNFIKKGLSPLCSRCCKLIRVPRKYL